MYEWLKAESERIGWPASFDTDLTTHDRKRLEDKDPPRRFGWVLRELGTNAPRYPG